MVNSNVTTITLDGNEIKIEFSESYPYYQITNKGDTDIYVSLSPNITPEAEGVYTVSAGGSEIIGGGYSFNAFYVLGTGKAYIRGKQNAMPASFKIAREGGGGSGDYSEFEQELDDIRNEVESLKTATGFGQLSVSNILNIPRGNSYRWVKIATIAMPSKEDDPIATRGEIFNTDLQSPGGYYEFLISGRRRVFSAYPTFLVNNFRNSDDEIALIYVSETDPLELWYKCGGYSTYGSGTLYHAIHYSITQFTSTHSSSFLTDLPDYGTRITPNSMYGN